MTSREIAYRILINHFKDGEYLNLALQSQEMPQRESGFITRLVYESVQNYDLMVYQFKSYLHKKVPLEIEIVLVMGAVQHFMFDSIEDYAIVNEMVNLTKKIKSSFSGLVNAVLKKVVKSELEYPEDLATRYSHPLWMVKLLESQMGTVNTTKLLAHNNTIAPLYVRLNKEFNLDYYPIEKNKQGHLVTTGVIFKTDALESGKIVIQDIASQEVVKTFGEINGRILDCCGAPGTKTSQLALRFPKAQITMLDLHEHRVKLADDLFNRLSLQNITTKMGDATEFEDELYDGILCDVPCSGFGVMRRKPDLRKRIQPTDLDSLQVLQRDILVNMDKLLKVGGQLVYSTCTLNKKENEYQIRDFMDKHPHYELVSERTIYPWISNSDGFYIALLVKLDN